jgi:hypothetical protein
MCKTKPNTIRLHFNSIDFSFRLAMNERKHDTDLKSQEEYPSRIECWSKLSRLAIELALKNKKYQNLQKYIFQQIFVNYSN